MATNPTRLRTVAESCRQDRQALLQTRLLGRGGPVTSASDFRQVRLAARGDVEAFAELYERGFRCAWAFAARVCPERDAAEALAEAVLTRAFSSLARFGGEKSWPAWLGAIAQEAFAERSESAGATARQARR
jgi:DNA-directed RNA polymerase specialized sigma24 family protein